MGQGEVTRKEYHNKMEAHTTRVKPSLDLNKMLGEKKVKLDRRELDLNLCGATLAKAQSQGLNP
jgi:hypothetical protein